MNIIDRINAAIHVLRGRPIVANTRVWVHPGIPFIHLKPGTTHALIANNEIEAL